MTFQELEKTTSKLSDKMSSWWETFVLNLPNIFIAIVVLTISYFLSQFIFKAAFKVLRGRVRLVSVAKLVSRLLSVITILAGLFLALVVLDLGESLTGLLTGAGISGLVIGLALQGTLSNTISGITLSFREKIRLGDWIETTGYAGEVTDISLNNLVLKEADNNIVVIPNKTIIENPLKNFSLTSKMRVTVECGVGYESDLDMVEKITKKTIVKNFDEVDHVKNVEFFYTNFADSSINYICRFWIEGKNSIEKLSAKSKAIKYIRTAYKENEINIPFPIRTIQVEYEKRIK